MESDWQQKMQDIRTRNKHLLETKKFSNCNFLVGSKEHQKIIAAHKLILASASPVFERMFYGELAEKNNPISIPDVTPDTFITMLNYIYLDHININSFKIACGLSYLADKYMLPDVVKQKCSKFLENNVNVKNACRSYEFAELFNLQSLREKSINTIINNTQNVLNQPNFTDISMSTLMAILDQNYLNISSELDLFKALELFANKRVLFANKSVRNGEQDSDPNSLPTSGRGHSLINPTNIEEFFKGFENEGLHKQIKREGTNRVITFEMRRGPLTDQNNISSSGKNKSERVYPLDALIAEETFRNAVKKIRFLTMTPQQFAEGPASSKLLKQHEALAFFILISKPSSNQAQLPKGFSDSVASRNCGRYQGYRC